MIIGRDLMVKLGLTSDFKRQVLQWDCATVPMKKPRGMLGKSDINKREMREVVIQTAEPDSTREANEKFVKILSSTYVKAELTQLANNRTNMNDEERTRLLRLLKYFEGLFDGTLGD